MQAYVIASDACFCLNTLKIQILSKGTNNEQVYGEAAAKQHYLYSP